MALDTYALITVEDYKAFAGISNSEIEADAISLYCSAGDATAATATKSGDTLTLVITGGANAGSNALDLTAAANDTLGELAAVIEALGGWTANLIGWASADSTDLKNVGSTSVLGSANEITLRFYDNYKIERLIDRASDVIETFLNRKIKSRDYTRERYDGGRRKLFLTAYPVTAVRLVSVGQQDCIRIQNTAGEFNASVAITTTGVILTVDGTAVAEKTFASYATMTLMAAELNSETGWEATVPDSNMDSWPSDLLVENPNIFCLNEYGYLPVPDDPKEDYTVDLDTGIVEFGYLGGGFQDVFVSYTGGYATVPDDIVMACCAMVKYYDDLSDVDLATVSEKLGDYSYKRGESDMMAVNVALSPDDMKTLQRYRRRPINP